MFEKESQLELLRKWTFIVFWILLVYHFYRYAWVAEDAFINLRVGKNFLAGYGLTWNPGERVQVFTSALWMLLSIAGSWVTGEDIYSLLLLSLLLVLATFWQLYRASSGIKALFLAVGIALVSSNSVRDYLSSGLETPLLMCVMGWFFGAFANPVAPSFRKLCFIAGMGMLVRHDSILLTAPFLMFSVRARHEGLTAQVALKCGLDAASGFLPFLVWTAFSVFYFGSLVPNTAAAKIVPGFHAASQAWDYFLFIQHFDPLAYVFMVSAMAVLYAYRSAFFWPALCAIGFFVGYLCKVGADYMAGRFLVAPMVMFAFLLVAVLRGSFDHYFGRHGRSRRMIRLHASIIMFVGFAMLIRMLTPANSSQYHAARPAFVDGIVDERQVYFQSTDLETILSMGVNHTFKDNAEVIRRHPGEKIAIACNIGMAAYFAPPDVYFVDPLALSDKFLSGLVPDRNSRIGHFVRPVPRQYLRSLVEGRNRFTDPVLRAYYDDIQLVTKGDLSDPHRWGAIWRLSTHRYANALEALDVASVGGSVRIPQAKGAPIKSCLGAGSNVMVPDQSSGQMEARQIYLYDLGNPR